MTREEIINGLKMSMELTLFDPSTGEVMEPRQLNDINRTAYEAYKGAIELLEEMPSVQPERKTGRWIPTTNGRGGHECSRCHEYAPCYQDGSEHLSTFCVLCGAKMEEGEQE